MGNKTFSAINLKNLYLQSKNIKTQKQINDISRKVTQYHYCRSRPKIRNQPKLIALSKQLTQQLGLDYQDIINSEQTSQYLSGSKLLPNSQPISNNYCGYQFGVWAGQLGDGRAQTIGHHIINKKVYELQLKGSGRTPFSRHADGNSVVSSAIRQFLASELLYGLKIPTTRALSLVIANQQVVRDPLYNGNIKIQNSAIVLRICQSFLRFGSVQVCTKQGNMRKQNQLQNRKILLGLFDYLLQNHYHEIDEQNGDPYQRIFQIIVKRTAQLVAYWQSIGFVHGVLNTDNMSLINLTIDYGPFAFIDYFSKDYVSNSTDQYQRYSYRKQPQTVKWNLNRLAQAMDIIVPSKILKKYLQNNFNLFYSQKYQQLINAKLGFIQTNPQTKQTIEMLFNNMDICSSHFTNIFRILQEYFCKPNQSSNLNQQIIRKIINQSCPTAHYIKNLRSFPYLIGRPYEQIPKYDDGFNIQFIKQQQIRLIMLNKLKDQSNEERISREKQLWTNWLNKYTSLKPIIKQNSSPKYVLLNQIAQKINKQILSIKDNKEQIEYLNKILQVFYHPYQTNKWFEDKFWKNRPIPIKLTCSS